MSASFKLLVWSMYQVHFAVMHLGSAEVQRAEAQHPFCFPRYRNAAYEEGVGDADVGQR